MRILLTGSSGQVGGALLPMLEQRGVVLVPPRDAFDLSRPETLALALDVLRPDLIINPAAYTAVDQAQDAPELAFRVNAEAPGMIAKWAARNDAAMIHFSTDYVFDGAGVEPWREDSEPSPLSVYGQSKLAGDQAVLEAGCAHLIVRTSWVYAARGRNFLTAMLRLASEREELRVVADQFGAPTPARVIAETLTKILETVGVDPISVRGQRSGILNIACSGEASWHAFAEAIVDGMKVRGMNPKAKRVVRISSSEFPTRAKRPRNSRLHLGLLDAKFGVIPPPWNQSLEYELDQLSGT